MIKHNLGETIITCDKCGLKQHANSQRYNEIFLRYGWFMSSSAKKYKHRCAKCQIKFFDKKL